MKRWVSAHPSRTSIGGLAAALSTAPTPRPKRPEAQTPGNRDFRRGRCTTPQNQVSGKTRICGPRWGGAHTLDDFHAGPAARAHVLEFIKKSFLMCPVSNIGRLGAWIRFSRCGALIWGDYVLDLATFWRLVLMASSISNICWDSSTH